MNRRFGFVLGISGLVGLALLGGAATSLGAGGAAPTARAVPRYGLISLNLRTHKEHVFPLGDLDALSPEGTRVAEARNPDNKQCLLFVNRLDGSHRHVLVRTTFPVCAGEPRWSPDGRTIAYLRFDPACATGPPGCHGAVQLWAVRLAGGPPKMLSDDAHRAAWSPDSRQLAFAAEIDGSAGIGQLTVVRPDGSERRGIGPPREIWSLSWFADRRRVLYSTNTTAFPQFGDGAIHTVDVASARDRVIAAGLDPKSSADGRFISFLHLAGARRALVVLHGGKRHVVLNQRNLEFVHAWSRTGHRLAFAITNRFGQAKVYVYDPGRPKPLQAVTRGQYGPVRSIAWSPDGRRLLFVRTSG
jgi:Tol biopolymer transport system component